MRFVSVLSHLGRSPCETDAGRVRRFGCPSIHLLARGSDCTAASQQVRLIAGIAEVALAVQVAGFYANSKSSDTF